MDAVNLQSGARVVASIADETNAVRVLDSLDVIHAHYGAYFNLQGEREVAEDFFARSFSEEPKNHKNTAMAAGSYVGVAPMK